MLSVLNNDKVFNLNSIEIKIIEHCNLNCIGCYSYSNIAKCDILYTLIQFENDLKQLSLLFKNVYKIRLLGGEPLLLKNILDYIVIAKKYFPMSEIIIVTNGILLKDLKEFLYEKFKELNIAFSISYYMGRSLKDVQEGIKLLKKKNIKFYVFPIRYFAVEHNDTIENNANEIFEACKLRIKPAVLYKGRMYACPKPVSIIHYDRKYNTKHYCEEDGIDIHNVNITGADVLLWLEKPMKTCRTCSITPGYIHWKQGVTSRFDWFNDSKNDKLINSFYWYDYLTEMNYLKYNVLEIRENRISTQKSVDDSMIKKYFNEHTYLWISSNECMYLYNELLRKTLLRYSLKLNYIFKTDKFINLYFDKNQICSPLQIPPECNLILLVKDKQDYFCEIRKIKSQLIKNKGTICDA